MSMNTDFPKEKVLSTEELKNCEHHSRKELPPPHPSTWMMWEDRAHKLVFISAGGNV